MFHKTFWIDFWASCWCSSLREDNLLDKVVSWEKILKKFSVFFFCVFNFLHTHAHFYALVFGIYIYRYSSSICLFNHQLLHDSFAAFQFWLHRTRSSLPQNCDGGIWRQPRPTKSVKMATRNFSRLCSCVGHSVASSAWNVANFLQK